MSEMIKHLGEISPEQIPDFPEKYPESNYDRFSAVYPDADVYLETGNNKGYLLTRLTRNSFVFMAHLGISEPVVSYCDDSYWDSCMKRSYLIVNRKGALPYAYRS